MIFRTNLEGAVTLTRSANNAQAPITGEHISRTRFVTGDLCDAAGLADNLGRCPDYGVVMLLVTIACAYLLVVMAQS